MGGKKCVQDYTLVCRTCLQSNVEMLYLSALINDNLQQEDCKISYMDCLRSCMIVEEIEEEMPARICLECASALQVAYWFMKNASQAQEMLKNKLRQLRIKKEQMELEASEMAAGEDVKKNKRYRCKICNVKVETKRSLKDHVKLHLDIIVYNCQLCSFESHTRNYLTDHYTQMHGIEASKEQLKPKTKTSISSSSSSPALIKTETDYMLPIKNEHFRVLPDDTYQSNFVQTFKTKAITSTNASSFSSKQLEASTVLTTDQLQNFTTFNTVDGNELTTVSNDLSIGNEFIVMADGSVEEIMGKGVVIEYINAGDDSELTLENGGLVLDNIMHVQNTDNTNLLVSQNDIIQMDVDDLIIEDPVQTPEETQDMPPLVDEDMIPVTIIKPQKNLNCKICTKDFCTQEQLKNHMLTHNEIPHFFCDQCKFYTFFKIDLHQHYKSKHNLHPTSKQLQPKNKQKPPKQVFNCDLCMYECEYKIDLKRHYFNKHKTDVGDIHLRTTNATAVNRSNTNSSNLQSKRKSNTAASTKNIKIKPIEPTTPDYPNGLNCRKCNEVFFWRNKLYEHYKLHNAEEAALKQEKQIIKVKNKQQQQQSFQSNKTKSQSIPSHHNMTQSSLEQMNTQTQFSKFDPLSLNLTQTNNNNTTLNAMAPLTPSSSSTYTLPSDAIPQIVETDQTIENDMDFDFNGDALFEDFDDDVDVENDSDENDHEFRNVLLTSDDDMEDMLKLQNNPHSNEDPSISASYCFHCQKNFLSQYQFENHMFVHRGLAPYRCEMCTNLYNTKRCLIRHYKAVHKKVPSRDMIQAKGDKVCVDKTPIQNLIIEETKSLTLMCAKCPYESMDHSNIKSHLIASHSLNDESYILKKLPYECPRCIRSFASKTKLVRHLERNHSSTPINEQQMQSASSSLASPTASTNISDHVNMMNSDINESDARCASGYFDEYIKQQQQQQFINTNSSIYRTRNELSIENAVAPNIVMANFNNDNNTNTTSNSTTSMAFNETSSSTTNNDTNSPTKQIITTSKRVIDNNDPEQEEEEAEEDEEENDDDQVEVELEEEQQALFKCKICHETCYNLDNFNEHAKRLECRKKPPVTFAPHHRGLFECEICHCSYKTMYFLKHHLKRHIGRKIRCPQCPKTFVNQLELLSHQHAHSGEKPHKCDLCPKSFGYVHHLKRHKDIIHKGKRHACTEPNCNRKFTTLSHLKVHNWTHSGIVPYKCQFCERLFKKRSLLRDHCFKLHNINLTEEEMAKIFRNSLGYTNPHDFTVAITNGKMLRRADLETMGASGVIKSSFK